MNIRGKTLEVEQQGNGDAVPMVHGLGGTSNTWYAQRAVLARSFKVVCPDRRLVPITVERVALHCRIRRRYGGTARRACSECGAPCRPLHGDGHLPAPRGDLPRTGKKHGASRAVGGTARTARKGLRDRAAAARENAMAAIADITLPLSTSAETRASRFVAVAMVHELLMPQSAEGNARTCDALAAARAAELERIKCPTILITGDEDGIKQPAAVKRLAQRIAGAKTVILRGTGHWTPIERPINEALLNFYFG
jgi:3-oxoadipate enol-lactonase